MTKALKLAQRAVQIGKDDPYLPNYHLALGYAEYRDGQYANAERAMTVAQEGLKGEYRETARLFRAMSVFRQDRREEARDLFRQAEAKMPPLPKDESNPLGDVWTVSHDTLICWLAYKEARNLLGKPAAKP